MCAISAIQHNPEMKMYYQKRVLEGKSKMSTVNIIRNKLIARVFAVVKRLMLIPLNLLPEYI
jgi:transposase